MPCDCPKRLRETLTRAGYALKRGIWSNGKDRIPDTAIDEHHKRIMATRPGLYKEAATVIIRDVMEHL